MVVAIQSTEGCRGVSLQIVVRRGITAQVHSQCLPVDSDASCFGFKKVLSSSPPSQEIEGNRHQCRSLMPPEMNASLPDSLVRCRTTMARHGSTSDRSQMTVQTETSKQWMDGRFTMGLSSAEPGGYLAVHQGQNGIIHLISSRQHYRFNLAWLKELPPSKT